ncbi:MAG: ATP-binding cassette domain-containing protein [Proteobacteria bacterium]|nr:ATP-binding cassette domain-containing protein [Pseudomonadota bacterium]
MFEDFNLSIGQGETWSVVGPSGCGKTTLLYFLARLIHPNSGTISIAGVQSERPRPETGLVLQDHGLLPWATVSKNVQLGLTIRKFYGADDRHSPVGYRIDKTEDRRRMDYWLWRLGIDGLKDKYPSQLSRGQRQRTAIARSLALQPDLLLLDEPFSALDLPTSIDLQKLMRELNREKDLTCIIVTHNIEEAVFMGEKILAMNRSINREANIVENECAGDAGHPVYPAKCDTVRMLLENRL